MKTLVIGAAGQLGLAVVARLAREHEVTPATRADVDLRNHRALHAFVLDRRPQAVINCAAFNNVDASEEDQEAALDINAFAVGTLSRATAELGAVLVHFSTDFVFAGTAATPYTEDDLPEPQSVYAQSKLLGEWVAADNPRHYVFRVESLFGGPRTRSSVDRIVDAVRAGEPAPVFVDRVVSPSFVDDVVDACSHVLRTGAAFGVYHCVNSGAATWLDVGREIARLLDRPETALKPISVRDVPLRARRPQYAALSNAKLARAGYPMPSWQDALGRYLNRRQAS
ncbi:MAG: dTDP-4-dehydrorhamnose reductase [Acidobacteria bacterium RIFCSPLOWO2_02_FULL_68_18]|nr:MAG: dTDP-4-dehydrorhamnose reductase [Acidobacteria bacterium RIFCSPLOWO2_02_FULL_68_18]